jgi:hypothetical protein
MQSVVFSDPDTVDNALFGGIITRRRWEKVGEIREKW